MTTSVLLFLDTRKKQHGTISYFWTFRPCDPVSFLWAILLELWRLILKLVESFCEYVKVIVSNGDEC